MQTEYATMMAEARKLVERAENISTGATAVAEVLRAHKQHMEELQETFSGRVSAICATLQGDADLFRQAVVGLTADIDQCLVLIEGKQEPEQKAETPAPLIDDSSLDEPKEERHGEAQ
jgi:hypothetical protein